MDSQPMPKVTQVIFMAPERLPKRRMSTLAQPTIAPKIRVIAPTMTTKGCAVGAPSKITWLRTTRYTPAVTIVAAWISADTGVGPAIASPSQLCSGNCADLLQAPSSNSRPIAVSVPLLAPATPASTPAKLTVPNVANMSMIATDMPKSPTRLATNALLAAAALAGTWFQKPMSRYDARPTPSQPT